MTLFIKIYNFIIFGVFLLILFFFEMFHIFLTIVLMHYIFLIYFGTTKMFKFQIYYSNFSFFKEIIITIKTYQIIKINTTQITDSTLYPNLSSPIFK